MIQVKKADPLTDSENIVALIKICRTEKKTVLNEYTVEEEIKYINNLHPRDAVFVAKTDSGIFVGFASINRRYLYSERLQHCGEVGTWVMPNFRRKGVGWSLWKNGVLPWCEKNGFKHLGFFILSYNQDAIIFYEKLGFRVCGYHRNLILGYDGSFVDALEMELWLDNLTI